MTITGKGWSAYSCSSPETLMKYIEERRTGHFAFDGNLFRIYDNKIEKFNQFDSNNRWIQLALSLNTIVQPLYGVVLKNWEEKPLIDFTKNLETTSGLPAKLLIDDFWKSSNEYNFLCLIKDPAASHDLIRSFNKFGECSVQPNLRLRNCPKKISIQRFINVHRNGSVYFYETQELAINNKNKDHIATAVPVKIDTVEGFDPRNIA